MFLNNKAGLLAGLISLLVGFANPVQAGVTIGSDYVIIGGTSTATNGKYYTTNNTTNGANSKDFKTTTTLGSFDRGTGQLLLSGESNTSSNGNENVTTVKLFYRVYTVGTTVSSSSPAFTSVILNQDPTVTGSITRWDNPTTVPNLIANTNGPGNYVLELFFQATGVKNSTATFYLDNNTNKNYITNFTVTGNVPATWNGKVSNDWSVAANWTPNVVPGPTTDALIPFVAGAAAAAYPTVSSGLAQVRTLSILGNNGGIGARNFLSGGELQVFGDFQDPNGGFGQNGGIFTLAGTTQTFDGANFFDIRIQGGGTKTLTNRMDVFSSLAFVNGGGIVATRTDNAVAYSIDLATTARIIGESETSYVLGILRSRQAINQPQTTSFGNIGVDLTTTGAPGATLATRLTGIAQAGVGTKGASIKRSFSFVADNPDNQNFGLAFHYLLGESNGLDVNKLALYRTVPGGNSFEFLGRNSTTFKTVIRNAIPGSLAATFTLGESSALPVNLTAFTAVAQGPDAILNWATAQEINSQGFEVQVSGDGTTFHKLGFVASTTPNSSEARTYQYRDAEAGKQGTRYYRLRQLDLDGKEGFFGPEAVTFGASALATSLQGYPNPFGSEINLALQSTAAGQATVSVLDGVGRQVRTWQPALAAGASSLLLSDLQTLPHGLYVVQVRYSDGQTQRLKLVKE